MKLEFMAFEKALQQLQTSLNFFNSELAQKDPVLRAQFRGASIQAYEFTYELAVKMIKRQLSQIVSNPQELVQSSFADVMRLAGDAGLITDVKGFLIYRDARNRTSHTYEEDAANEVMDVIPLFVPSAMYLLEQLKKRNG